MPEDEIEATPEFETTWDGRCVWVNDHTGRSIGRFTPRGVDVHKTGPEQLASGTQCLDCFDDAEPARAWDKFVRSMQQHHGVTIPDTAKPGFVIG